MSPTDARLALAAAGLLLTLVIVVRRRQRRDRELDELDLGPSGAVLDSRRHRFTPFQNLAFLVASVLVAVVMVLPHLFFFVAGIGVPLGVAIWGALVLLRGRKPLPPSAQRSPRRLRLGGRLQPSRIRHRFTVRSQLRDHYSEEDPS